MTFFQTCALPIRSEEHRVGREFFFSSRRRHTRYWRDWSSDVCSSDLQERWDVIPGAETPEQIEQRVRAGLDRIVAETGPDAAAVVVVHGGIIGEICRLA